MANTIAWVINVLTFSEPPISNPARHHNLPLTPLAWLTLLLVALYLVAWLPLGIYPDETALRLNATRVFADGWKHYGLFPACEFSIIPVLLRPAAWAFTQFDQWANWSWVRTLPLLVLLAWFGCVLAAGNTGWRIFLICGACVGAAGGGLILMRPEMFGLLYLVNCMLTFAVAKRRPRLVPTLIVIALHLFLLSVALLLHLQHILLVPLGLLSLWRLLQPRAALAVATTLFIGIMGYQTLQYWQFHCDANPALVAMVAQNQGSAMPLTESPDRLQRYFKRGVRYLQHSFYKPFFNPPHVPPVTALPARVINLPMFFVLAGNAFALLCVTLVGVATLWQRYSKRLAPAMWRSTWRDVLWDPWILITGCAVLLITYALYDVSGAFYRALTINLLAASLLAFAAAQLKHNRLGKLLSLLGALALVTCIASTAANYHYITGELRGGYVGPSMARSSDWAALKKDADILHQRCGIAADAPRVVIDDLSFTAMRAHPQLIHLVYVYNDEVVLRGHYDEATAAQRLAKLRTLNPLGVIASCEKMDFFTLPHRARSGSLCCLKP